MVTFKGYSTNVRYVTETGFGAGGSIGTAIGGKVMNFSPSLNNNLKKTQGIGEGRNATVSLLGNFDVSGTIEWEVADFTFLQYAIGLKTGNGDTASHFVLTEADNIGYGASDIPTFKMEVTSEEGATDDSDVYTGCHLTEISINANQGEVINGSANWVAKTVTSSASGTASYVADTQKPWMFWQGSMKWGASPSTVAKVTSFSITVTNNSLIYRALGDREIEQPETGIRGYEFTITVKMTDTVATTMRDDLYGQADTPLNDPSVATLTEGLELQLLLTEGSGSGDRNATIYLDEVNINDMSKPVDLGSGLVEVTFNGHARQAGNSAKPFDWFTTT